MQAILFSIITGVCFGLTMFMRKIGVGKIGVSAFIFEAVVEALFAIIAVSIVFPYKITQIIQKTDGMVVGIIAGLSMGVGVISFYLAAKSGSVILPSVLSPILGSLVASLLAIIFLGETLSGLRIIGLVLSIVGLMIFVGVK